MAGFQNTNDVSPNLFFKGMDKDKELNFLEEGSYNNAINAVNNSHNGDMYVIGNEPSNLECVKLPYKFIGAISLVNDRFAIFSTDNVNSEIGVFTSNNCKYETIVNDPCLGFKTTDIIRGASKESFDCGEVIYWESGSSESRMLQLDKVPYKFKMKKNKATKCFEKEYTSELDCKALKLNKIISTPTIKASKSPASGNLKTGSYQMTIAYTVNGIRVSDYFSPSNIQTLFTKFGDGSAAGGLEFVIENLDDTYDEYEAVLLVLETDVLLSYKIGKFSTSQTKIYVDTLNPNWFAVPFEQLATISPYYYKADDMYTVSDHLVRVGVYSNPEINYQPLANGIKPEWVLYKVPADYYKKGGNKVGYMAGEVYPFFIRWIYDTGHKTPAYHIPGRKMQSGDDAIVTGADAAEIQLVCHNGETLKKWEIYNTATVTNSVIQGHGCNEFEIKSGEMSYWESEEKYPDNHEVWKELSCENIRHPKFPERSFTGMTVDGGKNMLLLGVRFKDIKPPVDENGNPIQNIIGYEIVRGDRNANRSILAKGLIYNMAEFKLPDTPNTTTNGLYPNYPFNDLRTDPFLSAGKVKGGCASKGFKKMGAYKRDVFTFHSPETHFARPVLGEIVQIEGEMSGTASGSFEPVFNHPKQKFVRDFALITAAAVGIGLARQAMCGKKTYTASTSNEASPMPTTNPASVGLAAIWLTAKKIVGKAIKVIKTATNFIACGDAKTAKALGKAETGWTREEGELAKVPILGPKLAIFIWYWGTSTKKTLDLIRELIPYREHAYQVNSHGLYSEFKPSVPGQTRRVVSNYSYLYPYVQDFSEYRVLNTKRESSVGLKLSSVIKDPSVEDKSRETIGTLKKWGDDNISYTAPISSHYVSIRRRIKSQYGQIESVNIIPMGSGLMKTNPDKNKYNTDVLFGGDTYLSKFSLKRKQHYFNTVSLGVTDGYQFDYSKYPTIPYPKYWMNSLQDDLSSMFKIGAKVNLPNDKAHLDRKPSECKGKIGFGINNAYMYLYNSGIAEFFVESAYNLDARMEGLKAEQKFYESEYNTDLSRLFRSDVMDEDNHYEFDPSTTVSRMNNFVPILAQSREYDPRLAYTCFNYEPNKIVYSLPSSLEQRKDFWTTYLGENYQVFPRSYGKITSVRQFGRGAVIFFFSDQSPASTVGVDQLQTEAGVKITVGDGGLFREKPQFISNTEYGYAACTSRYSILSTHAGIFFASQKQGKVFNYGGQLEDISRTGMKWWFSENLPSRLLEQFPEFELDDNPSNGVGLISSFDNVNEIYYLSKVDYEIKSTYLDRITYKSGDIFLLDGKIEVKLGDVEYFEDASWTISYDIKTKRWISFHDWHPDFSITMHDHFFTIKNNSIWLHNDCKTSFCNFYGTDYPWEVEFTASNKLSVNTTKNVEYGLECFKYFNGGYDRNHLLDYNFDRAFVFNSEQHSGLLKLVQREKNNAFAILQFPKRKVNVTEIEVTKEEQKYRFNQFWDLTKDRGEFTSNTVPMWITEKNGYRRNLNPKYIDYLKNQTKRFRHLYTNITLRRTVSNDVKMNLRMNITKTTKSPR